MELFKKNLNNLSLDLGFCVKCGEIYTNTPYKWCKKCQKNYLRKNFINWTSENKVVDRFIQGIQLKIDNPTDIIFEWIPYNQFNDIKVISKNDLYIATWKDGSLFYDSNEDKYLRKSRRVALKHLENPRNIDKFLLKLKKYLTFKIRGISQDPNTKDYIMVVDNECFEKYCAKCGVIYTNIRKNKIIDDFIQETQLKIDSPTDIMLEWIPYDQFVHIRKGGRNNLAIWKNGPLSFFWKWSRKSDETVALIYLDNSKDIVEFLDEVKKYLTLKINIYGISQDPYTNDYIVVIKCSKECCIKYSKKYSQYIWCKRCQINYFKKNFKSWTKNEKIDNLIKEMQLKIKQPTDTIFEWIPYDQFNNVRKIDENNFAAVYSANWKDGPLIWNSVKYTRVSSKTVTLICMYNSEIMIDDFLNKVKKYKSCNKYFEICGITQYPYTKDYVIISSANYEYSKAHCLKCDEIYTFTAKMWCKPCQVNFLNEYYANGISGNEKIDNQIQEMQLKINQPTDLVFEWIPYNQFCYLEEIDKDNLVTVYSATWKDGPLHWNSTKYTRDPDKKVTLICINNSQNIVDDFLNKVKKYINCNKYFGIYGISQDPITKDYIIICINYNHFMKYCLSCAEIYTSTMYRWCKSCQLNFLKENFINWTSRDEKVDTFIQEMQLKINHPTDVVFEWIPYNKFDDIKEMSRDNFATIYLATLKSGVLSYDSTKNEYIRKTEKVTLKYLVNSQNTIYEFLNRKIKDCCTNGYNDFKIYGLSQAPNTKDYIIVYNYEYYKDYYSEQSCLKCENIYSYIQYKWCKPCTISFLKENFTNWKSIDEKIFNLIQEMQSKIVYPSDIVFEWIPYNQFDSIKEISKDDFATIYLAIWKNGPLYWNKMKYTRSLDKKVILKYIHNSHNAINEFLNEVKHDRSNNIFKIYGISQNPSTKNYIIIIDNNKS
ncbi:kinase-like domain-containing protein [Rhizophagus clarus]|uniref:Kinase-like domain-containing protein n=1 Tax=Rhizophagus clarus TaxID=94130 RepID=A0A8H3MCU4_9GLOM|nr:kinase-like domain-containing protein [Rhizophagus clarus]